MIDILGEWIIILSSYIAIIMTGCCFTFLVKDYVSKASQAVCAGVVYAAAMMVVKVIPVSMNNIVAYGIGVAASLLVLCIVDCQRIPMKVFLAVTFYSIRWLASALEISLVLKPLGMLVNYINVRTANATLAFVMFVVQVIVDLGVQLAMMLGVIYVLNRYFKYKTSDMSWRECMMLCMPSICAIFGYCVKILYRDAFRSENGSEIDDMLGIYAPVTYAYYIVSIISILVMIILFQELKRRQEEEMHGAILKMQVEDMRKSITQIEKNYKQVRSLRHDMGNHIQVLQGLIAGDNKNEAKEYIEKLENAYKEVVFEIKTGNPVTDIILNEKVALAREKEIRTDCDFHFPTDTNVDAFDIGIVLSNAIDNAIESVDMTNPYITVYSKRKENIYLIYVENTFDGELSISEDSDIPQTTKEGENHGWGMVNMRNCARKYYGGIDLEQSGDRVIFSAMFSLK